MAAIEAFLAAAQSPVLQEPGQAPIPLAEGRFSFEVRAAAIQVSAWNDVVQLHRKIGGIVEAKRGRLTLAIDKFGGKTGTIVLYDAARPQSETLQKQAGRHVFREAMRVYIAKSFPGWKLLDLSADLDLEHSLSANYPRALLRRGTAGLAVIGAGESHPARVLTHGLIWLDYLRHREHRTSIEGLALFVPAGEDRTTCLRLRWLDPHATRVAVFTYDEQGWEEQIDPAQHGNLDTRVDPPGALPDPPRDPTLPEAILERQVRRNLATIDAHLCPAPVYGQVPALAGVERGIMDLLAIDRGGRLAVIELKVTPEPRLPIQALDYWMRVRWHQRAGDFERMGYFAGKAISADPPRLLLVAPALEFHPTTETILRYFASAIPVERVGLAVEWRREPRVLFRRRGAMPPH